MISFFLVCPYLYASYAVEKIKLRLKIPIEPSRMYLDALWISEFTSNYSFIVQWL
jgi:hypothetical protein